jgi:CDP-diacylglycerol--serine O-phosphatidyltransferase
MKPARWRLVAPNAITAAGLVFGVLALERAVARRPVEAAWWGLYCTLTDKLDGLVAHALGATSSFGVQLDSLADLVAFGVVPPMVMYAFFSTRPELGWSGAALPVLSCAWVVAAAVRLARFNVAAGGGRQLHYYGTPSTMTAGIVLTLFLTVLKYADPALVAPEALDPWHVLGSLRTDGLLRWMPAALALGAVGMVSPLRVPRLGRTRWRALDAILVVLVVLGFGVGLFRRLPEYLFGGGAVWLAGSAAYHLRTRGAGGAAG